MGAARLLRSDRTFFWIIFCTVFVNFVSRLNRKIRVQRRLTVGVFCLLMRQMHPVPDLSFWGQKWFFFCGGAHSLHTPPLSAPCHLTKILNTPLSVAEGKTLRRNSHVLPNRLQTLLMDDWCQCFLSCHTSAKSTCCRSVCGYKMIGGVRQLVSQVCQCLYGQCDCVSRPLTSPDLSQRRCLLIASFRSPYRVPAEPSLWLSLSLLNSTLLIAPGTTSGRVNSASRCSSAGPSVCLSVRPSLKMVLFTSSRDQNVPIPGRICVLCLALQIPLLKLIREQRSEMLRHLNEWNFDEWSLND